MAKHQPKRMCAVCRESYNKQQLIRIVKSGENFSVDLSGKLSGRGCYVCKNPQCLEKLVKSKALNRAFKAEVPQEIYNQVLEVAKVE